jgi:hypothetical protein
MKSSKVEQNLTTTQKVAMMKELAKIGDGTIYQRVKFANEALDDAEWLEATHNGKLDKAEQALEDDCFYSIHAYINLGTLLAIYRMFPDEKSWQEYNYDLGAMEALYLQSLPAGAPRAERISYKKKSEGLQKDVDRLQQQLAYRDGQVEDAMGTIEKLRIRVEELERENAELRGQVKILRERWERELIGAAR